MPQGATGDPAEAVQPRFLPIALPSGANVTLAALPNATTPIITTTTAVAATNPTITTTSTTKQKSKLKASKKEKHKKAKEV